MTALQIVAVVLGCILTAFYLALGRTHMVDILGEKNGTDD